MLMESQYLESIYVKHVELKLKLIEKERAVARSIMEAEERMKGFINEAERNMYIALEPFLNDTCHTTCYVHEPIDYIEIGLTKDHLNLLNFSVEYTGAIGKNCFFDFFLYDLNDNLVDEFDIDFTLYDFSHYWDCDRRDEITSYFKKTLDIPIKDQQKFIFSNKKGNTVLFASPCVKITLHLKICFKRLVISTKDTVVGVIRCPETGERYAKPKEFRVELSSWNDEKTGKNIVKKFTVTDCDCTCVIYNYVPYKLTGNNTGLLT